MRSTCARAARRLAYLYDRQNFAQFVENIQQTYPKDMVQFVTVFDAEGYLAATRYLVNISHCQYLEFRSYGLVMAGALLRVLVPGLAPSLSVEAMMVSAVGLIFSSAASAPKSGRA